MGVDAYWEILCKVASKDAFCTSNCEGFKRFISAENVDYETGIVTLEQ